MTELEIINHIGLLIATTFSIILGIIMIRKYYKYKDLELLTMGFSTIFISSPWWGLILAFISYALFSIEISDLMFLFFAIGFSPIALILQIITISRLVYQESWKKISILLIVPVIIHRIFWFIFLFTNPSLLWVRLSRFDGEVQPFHLLYTLYATIIVIIIYTLFIRDCLRSVEPKIRLKGKFVYLGCFIYFVGIVLGVIVNLDIATLFARFVVMTAVILSYIGWVMPERVAKFFIKGYEIEKKEKTKGAPKKKGTWTVIRNE